MNKIDTEISVIKESWFLILAHRKQNLQVSSGPAGMRRLIAVFGGSAYEETDEIWRLSEIVGREIAVRGGMVMNGGYGGVMEGSAAGARAVDGETVGVTCDNLPPTRVNRYISNEWTVDRWDQRLMTLVWLADGYAVMPGASGTLVELSMVIETQLKGFIPVRPIICLGNYWKPVIARISGTEGMVSFTDDPVELADRVMKW